ncbi:MAG: hypothetical protein Q7T71_11325, partial [Herbiconiux sp.]|nr:hypothetical protein [Herbiconiux sp.]
MTEQTPNPHPAESVKVNVVGGTGSGQPTVGEAAKSFGAALGRAAGRTAGRAAHSTRESIRRRPVADRVYRTGVGVVGGTTVALGVALI